MIIKRDLLKELKILLKEYPVVTILGPRQSGKTTLAKMLKYNYYNLEDIQERTFAKEDPKRFLSQIKTPVILDEIQRVPELLSYIQVMVDNKKSNGEFVLTGSHQPKLVQGMSQSLAGRIGIVTLLPFSILELNRANIQYNNFQNYIFYGFLPRIYDQKQRPFKAYSNYYRTYVERDIRQLINLKNQTLFEKFMVLLAGRVGSIINYNSLANDVGVDIKSIKNWISILKASFIIYEHSPYFNNLGKRVIKSPKYYFTEVGLLSFLLGIKKPEDLDYHPMVGHIFENLVVIECLKAQLHIGEPPSLYFLQDSNKNELDIVLPRGNFLECFEIKSASTYHSSMGKYLEKIIKNNPKIKKANLIYNGKSRILSDNIKLINFKKAYLNFKK